MELSARQRQIADAAVTVVARGGARALTHRAIDREAALAPGSTSFYARTRKNLLQLTVHRIVETTRAGLHDLVIPNEITADVATDIATAVLEQLEHQTTSSRARIALLLELDDETDRAGLTEAAPVRALLLEAAGRLLTALDVQNESTHRVDLVGLLDALLLYRSLDIAPLDPRSTLHAYLHGLPKRAS